MLTSKIYMRDATETLAWTRWFLLHLNSYSANLHNVLDAGFFEQLAVEVARAKGKVRIFNKCHRLQMQAAPTAAAATTLPLSLLLLPLLFEVKHVTNSNMQVAPAQFINRMQMYNVSLHVHPMATAGTCTTLIGSHPLCDGHHFPASLLVTTAHTHCS